MEKQNHQKRFILTLIDLLFLNDQLNCKANLSKPNFKRKSKHLRIKTTGGHRPDCVEAICESKAMFSPLIQTLERRSAHLQCGKHANNQMFK